MIRYPAPLRPGDIIGVTAPSSGVDISLHPRLDLAISHMQSQGFRIKEGKCLRSDHKHVSASKHERLKDFLDLWHDPSVRAIIPPWGGELLIELIPLLDFESLAASEPKWVVGYSDTSLLLLSLTINSGIATAHGGNLVDSIPAQTNLLSKEWLKGLTIVEGESFSQSSSQTYQKNWADIKIFPEQGFILDQPTNWQFLKATKQSILKGRLIGGCLDVLPPVVGTRFADLPTFVQRYRSDGVILYLENCELSPCGVARALWSMRLASWFDGLAGIILGRSSGPDATAPDQLSYREAVASVLDDLDIPIIMDADIGHQPPQMTLINGALAQIQCRQGTWTVHQKLKN